MHAPQSPNRTRTLREDMGSRINRAHTGGSQSHDGRSVPSTASAKHLAEPGSEGIHRALGDRGHSTSIRGHR
eukprot:14123-Alexandrium_andersonii.AAC.1